MGILKEIFDASRKLPRLASTEVISFLKISQVYTPSAYTFTELYTLLFFELHIKMVEADAQNRESKIDILFDKFLLTLALKFRQTDIDREQHVEIFHSRVNEYAEEYHGADKTEVVQKINTYLSHASNTNSYFGFGTVSVGTISDNLQGIMELTRFYRETVLRLQHMVIEK